MVLAIIGELWNDEIIIYDESLVQYNFIFVRIIVYQFCATLFVNIKKTVLHSAVHNISLTSTPK